MTTTIEVDDLLRHSALELAARMGEVLEYLETDHPEITRWGHDDLVLCYACVGLWDGECQTPSPENDPDLWEEAAEIWNTVQRHWNLTDDGVWEKAPKDAWPAAYWMEDLGVHSNQIDE